MEPGLAKTIPRSTSVFFIPRRSTPTLSPADALSSNLRNISMSVAVVLRVSRIPTISTSLILVSSPRSTRPVTTVPRPSMLKTSSMHIRNGLSTSRSGSSTFSSRAESKSAMHFSPTSVPSNAPVAVPRTTAASSPGNSYLERSSRTSISTSSSNSSSSTKSHLLRKTTIAGTPT